MKIITTLAALAIAALMTIPAAADGLYEPPLYATPADVVEPASDAWTGGYVGIHGGYMWGAWDGAYSYDDAHKYPKLDFDGETLSIEAENWFGGVTIGADHQRGMIVAGVVIDASLSDIEATDSFAPYPDNAGSPTWELNTQIEAFGTARGRLGVLLTPEVLGYATGGLAWARTHSTISPVYNAGEENEFVNGQGSSDNGHIGWTVGGGLEWKVSEEVSIAAEYLYMDLGEQDYRFAGSDAGGKPYATDNFHPDLTMHVAKVGAFYRW